MAGTLMRPYKSGSIIYFEGDRGDSIYILQEGAIQLISSSLDSKEEIHENVKKGEFFGVKSSLGRYPREETAQVLADSVVLIFDLRAFENLCLKNVRLVLQMLKVFSSQLRKIHKQVREQLGEINSLENSAELLRVGEYYHKHGQNEKAKYVFDKFVEYYQDSPHYQRAVTLKQTLDSGQSYPEDMTSLESSSTMTFSDSSTQEFGGMATISQNSTGAGGASHAGGANSSAGNVSSIYYEGLNLISQENIDGAMQKFQEVMQAKNFANPQEAAFVEKAHFELNKCHLKKGANDTAIALTSEFIKKYPGSGYIKKALLLLAEAFENKNNMAKAMAFYTKVANMEPKDKDSSLANKKLEKLQS